MEKISAACAMGWSIELEKGLRSRKPGRPIQSIHQTGPRLQQWISEPQLKMPVYNMFGLVPGEDRVFADAILLRLADAFVSGDKVTKISILNILSTLSHCERKDGQAREIFSNMSLENRQVLLKRVKGVLSSECVESRALTLVLFGCWSEITKDAAEIRHAILSALMSCHVVEVKASLYAAACFSQASDDFGYIFLERLLKLMTSQEVSPALKIAGARTFSKMECSILLAIKSYKAVAELAPNIFEEDVLRAMLVSLTKLSCKASILISEQVGLLSSYLARKVSLHVLATILRCMRYIGEKAACLVPTTTFPFQILLSTFDDPSIPSALRCDILEILLKMIPYGLPGFPHIHINGFMKLLRYVDGEAQSSFLSESLLVLEVLVCASKKLKGRSEVTPDGNTVDFLSGVVSALSNHISQLMSSVAAGSESSEIEQELGSMLRLLLVLVENHSELGFFVLDKLNLLIENTVKSHTVPATAVHKAVKAGAGENKFSVRKFMFHMYKFLVGFLEILDQAGAATDQVARKFESLASLICGSSLFDCSIHTFYALLHSHGIWGCASSENKNPTDSVQGIGLSPCRLRECEVLIHKCAGNMLAGGDNWCAYKAGENAACKGMWYVANSVFESLQTRVQSEFCCQWSRFLVQYTYCEKNVQVLLQEACHSWPLEHPSVSWISSGYTKKLIHTCGEISSSDKVLEAISVGTQIFCFQRWFLALRVKVLLVWVDVLKVFDTCLLFKDSVESINQSGVSDITDVNPLLQNLESTNSSLVGIYSRLTRLTEEFDLIASSFIDIDPKSLKVISALAFSCSLLAFCTGFANLIAGSLLSTNPTEKSGCSHYVLAQNLARRVWHKDPETCRNLMSLFKACGIHESSLHMLPRFLISKVGCISDEFLTVCRTRVEEIIRLQNKQLSLQNKDARLSLYKDCMQLLLNVVSALVCIPFRVPKYFFRVRPSIGSVLISSTAGYGKQNEISVSPGTPLALNLCIQLKNIPLNICSRLSKIYCILYCKPSFSASRADAHPSGGETQTEALNTETMIDLNMKLQGHVMKETSEFMNWGNLLSDDQVVETCVCFETNGKAQGFSTCLLDVSGFPVGSYRIQWQSGSVDSQGAYWSILPLSPGPVFCVRETSSRR